MPAQSKAQQQLMGMAYALKRGEMDPKDASQEVKDLAASMTMKQLKDFAETKHEGLPDKVEEKLKVGQTYNWEGKEWDPKKKDNVKVSKKVKITKIKGGDVYGQFDGESKEYVIRGADKYLKPIKESKSNMKTVSKEEWNKAHKDYKTIIKGQKYMMEYDDSRDATILVPVIVEGITPANLSGMGAVKLPTDTELGSGDVPAGQGDAEEEYKKKRMKRLKTFEQFVNESKLNEANTWAKLNKEAEKRFGELGFSALSSQEMAELIDMKKADKLADNMFGEFGFDTLSEPDMEELINKNPKIVKV